jgi:hypothetical protein
VTFKCPFTIESRQVESLREIIAEMTGRWEIQTKPDPLLWQIAGMMVDWSLEVVTSSMLADSSKTDADLALKSRLRGRPRWQRYCERW